MRFGSLDRTSLLIGTRFALLVAAFVSAVGTSSAQVPNPGGGDVSGAVEVTMSVVDDEVRCGPQRARLPAQSRFDFRVANLSERPLWFVAPQFFAAANHIESAGFVLDLVQGGFLVAPQSTASVTLRAPAPGEFYFSCFAPGRVPNPRSSGFLIVVPAAR